MISCQQRSNGLKPVKKNANPTKKPQYSPINRQGLSPHFNRPQYGKPDGTNYNQKNATCPQWRAKTKVFDDPCTVGVRERQSVDTGDYQVTNFFRECGQPVMTKCTIDQTFTYPTVWGNVSQCHVDQDTDFRYPPLTNLKNVQQLFTRPYKSQGYQGAGSNNLHMKDLESALIQGNTTTTYKGCENTNEVYIDRFEYLPEYAKITSIEHTIEPWTRGGTLSRDLVRRLAYDDYCHMLNKARPY